MQKVCTRCKCILIAQQSCRKSSLNKRVQRKTVTVNVTLDHFLLQNGGHYHCAHAWLSRIVQTIEIIRTESFEFRLRGNTGWNDYNNGMLMLAEY